MTQSLWGPYISLLVLNPVSSMEVYLYVEVLKLNPKALSSFVFNMKVSYNASNSIIFCHKDKIVNLFVTSAASCLVVVVVHSLSI